MLVATSTPAAAAPQSAERFAAALTQLAAALGGAYGDEGTQVRGALDAMSRALAEWDREIAGLETRAGSATTEAQPHADLARAYLLRDRRADAVRELETAARLDPSRSETLLLLGQVQWRAGRRGDATTAFRRAWNKDRSNAVAAYWLIQSDSALVPSDERLAALAAMTNAYRAALAQTTRRAAAPFETFPPPSPDLGDAPLLLPEAYTSGYALLRRGEQAAALSQFREAAARDPLISDPANGAPEMTAGSAALRQGRVAAARERFQSAVSRFPASSEAHRLLGIACLFDFEPENSIAELEAAARLRPDDERTQVLLAGVRMQQGQLAAADAALSAAVRARPEASLSRLWLGSVLLALNRDDEAAGALAEVAARRPLAGEAHLLATIGSLWETAGNTAAAAQAFTDSILADANITETHIRAARLYVQQEMHERAFAEYVAALLIDPNEPNAYMGIGQEHLDAGRYAEAIVALQRLAALQPGYNQGQYALGTALLRAGRTEEGNRALALFARGQAQMAEERRRTLAAGVLQQEATARAAEGALDRAEALWHQIIALEPAVAAHYAALGGVLLRENQLAAAATAFERATALGGTADNYRQLAAIYARLGRQEDSVAAREQYERALLAPSAGGARR